MKRSGYKTFGALLLILALLLSLGGCMADNLQALANVVGDTATLMDARNNEIPAAPNDAPGDQPAQNPAAESASSPGLRYNISFGWAAALNCKRWR